MQLQDKSLALITNQILPPRPQQPLTLSSLEVLRPAVPRIPTGRLYHPCLRVAEVSVEERMGGLAQAPC